MRRTWPLALLGLVVIAALTRPPLRIPPFHAPQPEPVWEERTSTGAPGSPDPASETASPEPPASVPAANSEPASDPDFWRKSPILRSLVWLALHQNEDGSWGDGPVTIEGHTVGRAGVTALAIQAFVGHGYSHYSKDEYEGQIFGKKIRRAVDWLIRDLQADGRFASTCDGGFDQALTTYAISDYYGMTASAFLKEPVERALLALGSMQGPDGSWGGPAASAWALKAIASAEYNELSIDVDVRDRALRYAGGSSHPGYIEGRILLTKDRKAEAGSASALAAAPPSAEDLAGWYHASGSLQLCDGRDGNQWLTWKEGMKTAVLGQQGSDGSWEGGTLSNTVVRSSLALQCLEMFYRDSNAFAAAR